MPGPVISNIIPDWMKPENASVFDSPITSGLRKAGSFLGLTDPNSIMQVGAPMAAPISDESHPAIQALMEMLHSNPDFADPAKVAAAQKVTNYRVPYAGGLKGLPELPPEAAPMARPPALQALKEAQDPVYAKWNNKPEAPFQAVRSSNELSDITPATAPPARTPPPLQGKGTAGGKTVLGKIASGSPGFKLNPDSVKAIREMVSNGAELPEIMSKFPDVSKPTLKDVISGGSWAWVK